MLAYHQKCTVSTFFLFFFSLWRRVLEFPLGNKIMFQNPNVLLDFSNYGPVDDWTQVTVMTLFLLFIILLFPLSLLSCH